MMFLVFAPFFGALLGPASARALPSLSICACDRIPVKLDTSPQQQCMCVYLFLVHTCAKDMQWESSSRLPTGGDEHCPFSSGKLLPSKKHGWRPLIYYDWIPGLLQYPSVYLRYCSKKSPMGSKKHFPP